MKQLLIRILVLLLLIPCPARAEAPAALISEMLQEQIRLSPGSDLQGWIDTSLSESAEGIGGWYLIALRRLASLDADASGLPPVSGMNLLSVRSALEEKAAAEKGSITKRERMALTLQALGSTSPFIRETVMAARKETTLMPLVFALHLLNNLAPEEEPLRQEILGRVLDLQLEDGGWAVIGNTCDVDCTAMVLQALAPLREGSERVQASAARGVAVLSGVQQENGGFLGLGMESAESCAQVLLALSDLGIDARRDDRFIKGGCSALDAMLRFRLPGDGFAHSLGGSRNDTATVQCFYALTGYESFLQGGGPYYVFRFEPLREDAAFFPRGIPVRTWLLILAGLLTVSGWILAAVRKKRNWRSYVFPLLLGLAAAGAALGIEIQSPESYYGASRSLPGERTMETVISIRCDSVAGENEYAPADGILLSETPVLLAEDGTAFDQLLEATRRGRIQMEYDGTTAGAYVRGIGYLYEYDFGSLSGWMYRVNGVYADVGCSQFRLHPGDRVEWIYTRNLGRDEQTPAE